MAKQVRKKTNTQFVGGMILIAIVGIGILGYALSRPRAGIRPVDPNLPPGTAEGYLMGRPDAPVQVIEFGDFECPACGQWAALTEPDVRERLINTGLISFRFFDFPLDIHPNSWPAHNAVACAADQGKYAEMHDQVFALQGDWAAASGNRNPRGVLRRAAQNSGVELGAWDECFDSQKHYPRIKANAQEGIRRGVGQTPTFIIGNTMYPGNIPYDEFKRYVDQAAAAAAAAQPKGAKAPGKSGG